MFAFRGGYCGLAPVPGGRVNVGIVLEPARWGSRLRLLGARAVAGEILLRLAPRADGLLPLMAPVAPAPLDTVAGAVPLAHAVGRVAGDRWLLVGDAAGFLDPFTGEGIGRAFTTARLAAEAIDEWLSGRRGALDRYDGVVRRRYRGRDRLTWIVQQFLTRPALFEYATRRLATRDALRHTLDAVLAERLPAERAIDPRFLAALLRP